MEPNPTTPPVAPSAAINATNSGAPPPEGVAGTDVAFRRIREALIPEQEDMSAAQAKEALGKILSGTISAAELTTKLAKKFEAVQEKLSSAAAVVGGKRTTKKRKHTKKRRRHQKRGTKGRVSKQRKKRRTRRV